MREEHKVRSEILGLALLAAGIAPAQDQPDSGAQDPLEPPTQDVPFSGGTPA
jgi:hypothetical protein